MGEIKRRLNNLRCVIGIGIILWATIAGMKDEEDFIHLQTSLFP